MKARHEFQTDESYKEYLRTYFATKADVSWQDAINVLNIRYPDKINNHTVQSILYHQAGIKVAQVDALIKALNQ